MKARLPILPEGKLSGDYPLIIEIPHAATAHPQRPGPGSGRYTQQSAQIHPLARIVLAFAYFGDANAAGVEGESVGFDCPVAKSLKSFWQSLVGRLAKTEQIQIAC